MQGKELQEQARLCRLEPTANALVLAVKGPRPTYALSQRIIRVLATNGTNYICAFDLNEIRKEEDPVSHR